MSYTVLDVVTRALTRLHVLRAGEAANAEDVAEGVIAYNELMFGFAADGMSLHTSSDVAYTHATQAQADAFPLADKHFGSVSALLAKAMAPTFEADIDAALGSDIVTGLQRLYADFLTIEEMTVSGALSNMPSQTAADGGY